MAGSTSLEIEHYEAGAAFVAAVDYVADAFAGGGGVGGMSKRRSFMYESGK